MPSTGLDKLIFLFTRKDGLSREEFFAHYLDVHTLLGMRLCTAMDGYTVNLTQEYPPPGGVGPDAITEVWTLDVEAFMDPSRSFASEEDFQTLWTDDRSFIGDSLPWVVDEELVLGDPPCGELRARTPGVKRISLWTGDARPPAAPGVTRIVEQRVRQALHPQAPAVDVFVSEWARSPGDLAAIEVAHFLTSEYRQKDPLA